MPSDPSADADRLALQRTLEMARTRPHGRTERFEDSHVPNELGPGARRPGLRLGEVLGEGGMGTVRVADQPGLEREVAVKTLRAGPMRASAINRFLQEARVGGLVEHPNVIPVYDLVVTEDGSPALVMKRVAGEPWTESLRDAERLSVEDRADPLAFHLRVLMAVCDAVQYAHDAGVVHRDIKPDNVMIGSLGEVYLLDWGLALSTREEHAGFIALASEAKGVAGTPAYMAPEMAAGDATALGPRTDVYLLGAALHEIVTGQPPHTGTNLYQVALEAFESTPHDYGPDVPPELAAICHRAMAREPDDRFASAAALRDAVEAFLTHRASHELASRGREALARLDARIDESPDHDAPIQDLFGAVRFSLGQAVRLWPGNEAARADWQRALARMGLHELSRGRAAAAAALLAERAEPDEELAEALRRARDRRERRDEEVSSLRRLQREHDLSVNDRKRSRLALYLGVFWVFLTVVTGRLKAAGLVTYDHTSNLVVGVFIVALIVAVGLIGRALVVNVVNRRIYVAAAAGLAAALFGRVAAALQGIPVPFTFAREQLIFALIAACIAIISDARIFAGTVALTLTAVASSFVPEWSIELGGLGLFVAHASMAFAWSRPR